MTLRTYARLWLLATVLLAYESLALNLNPYVSVFALLKENTVAFRNLNLSPAAGKPISYWYGWIGFSLMIALNAYSIRKRWSPLRRLGQLGSWMNFHIFCGLLGPTFILFHTNFKVGGLVAVSFWSMVVSFASGIIGRYFFLQISGQRVNLQREIQALEKAIGSSLPAPMAQEMKTRMLQLAGTGSEKTSILSAFSTSVLGDLRLRFGARSATPSVPDSVRRALKELAVFQRRLTFLSQFEKVMGYWHSFHLPFAVFMYVIAAIHIAVTLLLAVN